MVQFQNQFGVGILPESVECFLCNSISFLAYSTKLCHFFFTMVTMVLGLHIGFSMFITLVMRPHTSVSMPKVTLVVWSDKRMSCNRRKVNVEALKVGLLNIYLVLYKIIN